MSGKETETHREKEREQQKQQQITKRRCILILMVNTIFKRINKEYIIYY